MNKTILLLTGSLLVISTNPALGQRRTSRSVDPVPPQELVMGREAKLGLRQGGIEGELLSVSTDSLWVLSHGTLHGLLLGDVRRVDVRMHKFGTKRALAWNFIAGLGSAIALSAACSSVEGADMCGGVFVTWSLAWGVIGGIAGTVLAIGSRRQVSPSPDALRPYVRYPQGMPRGVEVRRGPVRPGG